jgi:hypothetical protein
VLGLVLAVGAHRAQRRRPRWTLIRFLLVVAAGCVVVAGDVGVVAYLEIECVSTSLLCYLFKEWQSCANIPGRGEKIFVISAFYCPNFLRTYRSFFRSWMSELILIIVITWDYPPDHLLLDRAPNLGPLVSRYNTNKFENCWYESVRILEVLKPLFR